MKLAGGTVRAAARAIEAVLGTAGAADRTLSAFFRENRVLGRDDRAIVAEVVYAVLRRLNTLEQVAGIRRPLELAMAALVGPLGRNAGEVSRSIDSGVAGVDAMRARWHAALEAADPAADLPDWLWARLVAERGEVEAGALAFALLDPAPLDLRVNAGRASRDAVLAQLRAEGWPVEPTPFAPLGLRIAGRPALQSHPLFLDGTLEVQDEASQLVCHLLAPRRGEMVVDFCAGAGGKTLALAALMRSTGRIYAFDISQKRLEHLRPRLARSGASNVHPQRLESERDPRARRLAGKIDRLLVDAPCTGLGTLRRNPELKWRQQPNDVAELVRKQGAILEASHRLVKPGGHLVYATCSLLGEENEGVIEAFLAAHPEFEPVPAVEALAAERIVLPPTDEPWLRLLPHQHHTDGFFAALLRRRA
jgi:16S rRNA (cytosine967-C5)-methyltransferase